MPFANFPAICAGLRQSLVGEAGWLPFVERSDVVGTYADAGPSLVAIARVAAASAIHEDVDPAEAEFHGQRVVVAVTSPATHPDVTAVHQGEALTGAKYEKTALPESFALDRGSGSRVRRVRLQQGVVHQGGGVERKRPGARGEIGPVVKRSGQAQEVPVIVDGLAVPVNFVDAW